MSFARPFSVLLLTALAAACTVAQSTDAGPAAFEPELVVLPADPDGPDGYEPLARFEAMSIPVDNPLSVDKVTLGKQLYYDPRLSGDGSRSCYSCHVCEYGLTDGLPLAIGAYAKQLTRSSPTLWNIGFHEEFYWDGRAGSLEAQAAAAWTGGNMGAKEPQLVLDVINALPGYRSQFERVFHEPATVDNVPKALAAYMRTIISEDTAWDRWQAGDESAVSDAAKRGWEVFQAAGCSECHSGVLFTDLQYHNVGIGVDAPQPDVGRFKVTQVEANMSAFKTPTLRDISESGPYFHDGSVETLEEAVRFMLDGGQPNPHLSDKLKPYTATDAQVADLLAFLASLDQPCDASLPRLP